MKQSLGWKFGCQRKVTFLLTDVSTNVNIGPMPVTLEIGRRSKLCLPGSCMLMALPSQAGKPQGHCAVKHGVLVDNVSGTGRGWQQSRSNWTLLAVAGYWARVHVVKQLVTTSFLLAASANRKYKKHLQQMLGASSQLCCTNARH